MDEFTTALVKLIEGFEGFRSRPYQDEAGVWTIGFGHTKGVTKDTPRVTRDEAIDLLLDDMQEAIDDVDDFLEVDVNDNQYAALVSIVYNAGTAVLEGHLGEYLNQGDFKAAAGQFDVWIYVSQKQPDGTVKKVKSNGLISRRAAEKALFLTAVEEPATHNID